MKAVRVITGSGMPLRRSDVDTDQIIPKQFLKRIERSGFGEFAFFDWKKDPNFITNDARYAGARGFVDAIVYPEDTRTALALALRSALHNHGPHLGAFVLPSRMEASTE